jgi:GGDEF domain-containing protein
MLLDMEGNLAIAGWDQADRTGYGLETTWEGEAWMPRLAAYIRTQAGIDPLTGLDARPRFEARVVQELKRAARSKHPTAVAVIEVQASGSDIGCLMVQAATLLGRELRDLDSIARISDSQFAALLPMCDSPSAALAVARALAALSDIPGARVSAGVSSTAENVGWDIIDAACANIPSSLVNVAFNPPGWQAQATG